MWKSCSSCYFCDKESQPLLDNDKNDEGSTELQQYGLASDTKRNGDESKSRYSGLIFIKRFTVLMLVMLFRSGASLSSQLAGGKSNIFQLNSIRYAIIICLVLGFVIYHQKSLRVENKYIFRILVSGFFNYLGNSGIFFAISFMPVGNVEAMYLAWYIFIPTVIDFIQRRIQLFGTLSSATAIVGLILLAQPWREPTENVKSDSVPCDYWESNIYSNISNETVNGFEFVSTSHLNFSNTQTVNSSTSARHSDYFIYIDGVKHHTFLNPLIIGYVIIILAAVSSSIRAYISKGLREQVASEVLIFWLSFFEGSLALLVTVIWSQINGLPLYSFPSGTLCLTITLLYSCFSALTYLLWVLAVGYFNVSKLALCNVVILLLLYVCQRTFLKPFHPGEANLFETFGVVVIFCGLLIAPISEFIHISEK